jgi:hypothetical protein
VAERPSPFTISLPPLAQVLSIFPTPIRRRIMRYLYIKHLRGSYLFKSCPSRFMDALLASARVEVFMPGVRWGIL